MTEFHLEGLRDRELTGEATPAELEQLQRHREECAVCRLESEWTSAQSVDVLSERALLERVYARVEQELDDIAVDGDVAADPDLALDTRHAPPGPGFRRSRRLGGWIAAAAVFGSGVAAAAMVPSWRQAVVEAFSASEPQAPAAPRAARGPVDGASPDEAAASEDSQLDARDEQESPEGQPGAGYGPTGDERTGAEQLRPQPRAPDDDRSSEQDLPVLDAQELFKQATQARRQGDSAKAARLYRLLQERFPGSSRALISRISLGELLLGTLGQPQAALAEYDAYLAASPSGSLAEQALAGRARALRALGRVGEERATWRRLLSQYPDSLHAQQARSRLAD